MWFAITILILLLPLFPLGIWLILRAKGMDATKIKDVMKKVLIGYAVFAVVAVITAPTTESASKEYVIPGQPAKEAVYKDAKSFVTAKEGDYVIGVSPSELASGREKKFTTSQSGEYVAGEDFEPGIYDLVAKSGGGNVMGTDLNCIMGTAGGDFYSKKYENKLFEEGDVLEVKGVSLQLVPKNKSKVIIPEGKYNLVAKSGGGNVIGSGINAIMGVEGGDFYDKRYDNKTFNKGDKLSVKGVSIQLQPKEKKILVSEATEATPDTNMFEEVYRRSDEDEYSCYLNDESVDCSELKYFDELKAEVEKKFTKE